MNYSIKNCFFFLVLCSAGYLHAMNVQQVEPVISQQDLDDKLIFASTLGNLSEVQSLLARKANINAVYKKTTPLKESASCRKPQVFNYLLHNGADDTLADFHANFDRALPSNETTMQVYEDYFGNCVKKEIAQALPNLPQETINLICSKMYITDLDRKLGTAIWSGDTKEIEKLLQDGADPNMHSGRRIPLWEAFFCRFWDADSWAKETQELVRERREQIIKLLLRYGASPNSVDVFEVTDTAERLDVPMSCVKWLLRAGTDTEKQDEDGNMLCYKAKFKQLIGNDFRAEVKDTVNKTFFARGEKYDDLANIVAYYVI